VLFADVRGYTKLTSGLAPEEVPALVNRFYETASTALLAHDGLLGQVEGEPKLVFELDPPVETDFVNGGLMDPDGSVGRNHSIGRDCLPSRGPHGVWHSTASGIGVAPNSSTVVVKSRVAPGSTFGVWTIADGP
jgi:class 3 adenylate cyclase